MKKLFLISGAFASIIGPVATVVACGDEDEKDEKKIAMILSTKNNPFFQQLAKGAEDEAKKQGYNLKIYVSNNDQAEETKKIDLAISEGYKTLILNGLDARQSAANAKKAIDAGIKVIAVDRPLSEEAKVWTTVSSNNIGGAKKLAKKVFDLFKTASLNNIKMLHLQGIAGEQNGIDRWNGFKEAQNEETSFTIQQIYEQRANYDRTEGNTKTGTAMTNDDSIKLINADNDEMALGAIASLGSKVGITTSKIIVTGFDGTADAIASVNTDKMFGTVKQNPLLLGKKSIQAAIEALGDKDFEDIQKNEKLLVETTVITKENVGDFLT